MATEAYVKGSLARLVTTPGERVAAEFDGFKPASEVTASVGRAELQATAKSLGIKANQSNEALAAAIADFKPAADAGESGPSGDAPVVDNDDSGTEPGTEPAPAGDTQL